MSDETATEIPESFYGSSLFRYRLSTFAYRAYCRARDTWLAELTAPRDATILDLGCSTGEALADWAGNNAVVGFDHSLSALHAARSRGFVPVCGRLSALPFAPGGFDVVSAMGIIGASDSPQPVMEDVCSLLRDGGRALFAIAVYGGARRVTRPLVRMLRIKNEMRHIPSVDECRFALDRAGLEISTLATSPLFPSPEVTFSPSPRQCRGAVYLFVDAYRR